MSQGTTVRFTYDDYLLLPEESRYEIIDGDLQMSPAPTARHQRIVREIVLILAEFVRRHDLGEVMVSPFDVILSETDVVQPDILFVTKDRASIIREKGAFGAPDLVIEILSPATANRDRTVKAKLYARAGVRELWLVDPDAKTVEVLSNGPAGFQRTSIAHASETASSQLLLGLQVAVDKVL